jgi:intraflagellar transport protein 88
MKAGEEFRTRPMTAGAGYSSSTSNTVKQKLEVYQRTKSVFEIIRDTEKEIHSLIEESSAMFEHSEISLALEKAKQAATLEKKLSEQRELNDSKQEHGVGLSFAVWFHLANAYEKNGMFSESIETYLFLLSKRKFHSSDYITRIRINMGSLHHSQKNYQESIKMYRMALDQLTRDDRALRHRIHQMIGNIFVELGRLREAIFDYEAVVMSSDADLETCFNLLLCYVQTGCTDKVKQTFMKMIGVAIAACNSHTSHDDTDINSGGDTHDLLLSASRLVCLTLRGQYWEQNYKWVRDQIKDQFPSINHHLGIEEAMQHLRENNFDSAIKILKEFENKDTQVHPIVSINLTFIHSFEGMHDSADEFADIAVTSNRFNPSALVNKGNRLFVRNDFEGAKEFYLEAINIDSSNFEAIYNLGLAFSRLGLHSDALRSFQKLQLQHANDPRVLYQIANISAQTNDKESTVKWFNVLSSCLPTDAGVFSRLAELCDDDVNNSQRFHNYLESHRLYPSNIDTIGHLAVWFVEHELYEKALYFFRCASVIRPNENKWKFMLASCYRKLMKTDEAFNIYESILEKSPSDHDCLLSLIHLCKEVGISSLEYEKELVKVDRSKLNVIRN